VKRNPHVLSSVFLKQRCEFRNSIHTTGVNIPAKMIDYLEEQVKIHNTKGE
jgi:hypothetical protein